MPFSGWMMENNPMAKALYEFNLTQPAYKQWYRLNQLTDEDQRTVEARAREIDAATWKHSEIWPCEHCAARDPHYMQKGKPR